MEARNIKREDGRRTVMDESYVGALQNKWGEYLDGVPSKSPQDRYTRGVMAMMYENQAQYLQNMNEDTRQSNVGTYTKFIFPVLRRVFPNLIANEIVSVQPMTAPVGAVFFLDWLYGTNKGQTAAGNVFPRDFDRDYSSEFINGEPLATGNAAPDFGPANAALNAVLAFTPVRPLDTTNGYSVVIKEVNALGTVIQTATDNGLGTFTGNCAVGSVINYANGSITNFRFTVAPALGNRILCEYSYDGELNSKIPQMSLDIKQAPVQAKPRRIKALWSSEAAEDLRALHGVDAEAELVAAVGQEMALEIDREIIQQLFAASVATTGTFDRTPPAGISEVDHLRSMITVIATVSNLIHKKTLRAPANWIVTSPEVSALFAQLTTHGDFRPIFAGDPSTPYGQIDMIRPGGMPVGQFGIYKAGTLQNKWMVYEDPFFTRDRLMVGYKGPSYLHAGFAFAPYIPMQLTPSFLDPSDMSWRKGMRSRYATKLLRAEFYGQVRVLNL